MTEFVFEGILGGHGQCSGNKVASHLAFQSWQMLVIAGQFTVENFDQLNVFVSSNYPSQYNIGLAENSNPRPQR